MGKQKYISGSTSGDIFEKEVFTMLDALKIAYRKEKTLSNAKVRKKDKGCDIEILEPNVFIELKTKQDDQALSYDLTGKKDVNLKNHQIKAMDYLVIQFRPNGKIDAPRMFVLSKVEFTIFAATHSKNSINLKDCIEYGKEITDMSWLLEVQMTIQEQIDEQNRIIIEATKKLEQLFVLRNKEREISDGQLHMKDIENSL